MFKDMSKLNKIWLGGTVLIVGFLIIYYVFSLATGNSSNNNTTKDDPGDSQKDSSIISVSNCATTATKDIVKLDTTALKTDKTIGELDFFKDTETGGPTKNGIPAIDNPKFLTVEEAEKCIKPEAIVFVLEHNGVKKIYPQQILVWHEITNDEFVSDETGERTPVTVTFCPLCNSSIAFIGIVNGEEDTFGVSGRLYQSDLLMFDRKTESLWSQIEGRAVIGELTGTVLERLFLEVTTFGEYIENNSDALVLSFDTGSNRNYDNQPYAGYDTSAGLIFDVDNKDDRLFTKDNVVGVEIDGEFKAYPTKEIDKGEITDEFAGKTLKIYKDADSGGYKVFEVDENGKELEQLDSFVNFWFAWAAFHPTTSLYGDN
ncbi:MAG TPA: DUF3179 domain-containing protein [bacterium]|nr:DUF3179 domain-containing protein [bacterium]